MATGRNKKKSPARRKSTVRHAAEQNADHYKVWILYRSEYRSNPRTFGQFDAFARWRSTIGLDFIANPVAKNGVAPQFPEHHLTGYALEPPPPSQPEPHRRVVLSNQFGDSQEWHIGDPVLLFLPAGKSVMDDPLPEKQDGTHYLCYQVLRGDMVDTEVTLSDQFDERLGVTETVGPLFPAFFGVPVEKNGEPIGDPDVHYAFYRFQPRAGTPPIYIHTVDQFIPVLPVFHTVLGPTMLAVPSLKLDWNPEP
jgi:hypothetical protein